MFKKLWKRIQDNQQRRADYWILMNLSNKELHDMDIRKKRLEDRQNETLWDYHNNLMELIEAKRTNGKKASELYGVVNDNLSKCISLNRSIVDLAFDIAKRQLQEAFEKSGLVIKDENGWVCGKNK